jgi:hypothetical protein
MPHKKDQERLNSFLRLGLIAVGVLALLTAALLHSSPQAVSAAPGDLSSAVAKYPNLATSLLNQCSLCHLSSIPNLNPYGAAYKAAGRNSAAFAAIENLDSDKDGATNLQEIQSLTFPGDASSVPAVPTATATLLPPTAVPTSISPTATGLPPTPSGQASVNLACPASVLIGTTFTCTLSVNPAGTPLAGLQINFSGLNGSVGYTGAQFTTLAGPSPVSLTNVAGVFTWAGSNGYLLTQSGDAQFPGPECWKSYPERPNQSRQCRQCAGQPEPE